MTSVLMKKLWDHFNPEEAIHSYSHLNFCSLEFSLLSLPFFMGRKWARTCMNCRKLTRSLQPSSKKACTMRSPKGFMASSGIRKKSSRLRVPQSPRSKLVNLLYRRSIWLGVTINKQIYDLHLSTLKQKINSSFEFRSPPLILSLFH
jgi:hypothetical protein